MRVVISALLVTLTLVIVVGCGGGGGGGVTPQTIGSLAGYIYAEPGSAMIASDRARVDLTPLINAVVTVRGQQISAITDANGQFLLDGVYTGSRQFYIECDGYARSSFSMDIAEGPNTIPSSVSLEPAALKWMVMVYMAADNNLDYDGFAAQDLNEMEMAANSPDVTTLVLADLYGANNTRLYRMEQDGDPANVTSPVIYNPGELNTGDTATLGWFVNYCQTDPDLPRAEHYMLVLWDHGSGWSSYDDRSITLRAIGVDDSSGGDIMRIIEIPPVLTQPYPIDIVATDACLMNQLEVAYEWKACADYLVASEELTPGEGFDYTAILTMMTSSEGLQMSSGQMANSLAETVYSVWENDYGPGSPPPVISAVDLPNLGPVQDALDAFSRRLISVGGNYGTQLSRVYDNVDSFSYWFDDHRVDLYDYADRVSAVINDSSLDNAAGQLKTAINNAVTASYHIDNGPGESPGAHGLSIYLPQKVAYNRDAAGSYPGLMLSADTKWNEWLASQPDYVDP